MRLGEGGGADAYGGERTLCSAATPLDVLLQSLIVLLRAALVCSVDIEHSSLGVQRAVVCAVGGVVFRIQSQRLLCVMISVHLVIHHVVVLLDWLSAVLYRFGGPTLAPTSPAASTATGHGGLATVQERRES